MIAVIMRNLWYITAVALVPALMACLVKRTAASYFHRTKPLSPFGIHSVSMRHPQQPTAGIPQCARVAARRFEFQNAAGPWPGLLLAWALGGWQNAHEGDLSESYAYRDTRGISRPFASLLSAHYTKGRLPFIVL